MKLITALAIIVATVLLLPYVTGWISWSTTDSPKFCSYHGGWFEPAPCNKWEHCYPPKADDWAIVGPDGMRCRTWPAIRPSDFEGHRG